jgi:hypothetical protein
VLWVIPPKDANGRACLAQPSLRKGNVAVEVFTTEKDAVSTRLRAMVEIVDGELKIYPFANSHADERRILALRFGREDFQG